MKRPYQIDPRPSQDFIWLASSATLEQVMDQLHGMRRLESTTYTRCDYLYRPGSPYTRQHCPAVNEMTRQNMVDFLVEIGDYCHFRRETVSHAVWNVMDRYLSLPDLPPLSTKTDFQLLASGSLFIAVKVLEPISMDVQSLADLSSGAFDCDDILQMEQTILFALKWAISHGPTPIAYVQLYLSLLQMDGLFLPEWELWDALFEQAQYQVELAAVDYQLVTCRRPSEVALAAVWNALESKLEGHVAEQWQNRLMEHLAPLEFDATFLQGVLPKVQLTLCMLQYSSEAHYQERLQLHPQELGGIKQEESEGHGVADDPMPPHTVTYHSLNEEKVEDTDFEEEDSPSRYRFPSPVSVVSNQLSAHYEYKKDTVCDSLYNSYGLGFLRSLFY